MELTQTAKAQYLDEEMGNDAKRTILTKLFDSVVYENNPVSVKLSFLAESINKRSGGKQGKSWKLKIRLTEPQKKTSLSEVS